MNCQLENFCTALHESGHVAAHLWFGRPFDTVDIIETEDYRGVVKGGDDIEIYDKLFLGYTPDLTPEEADYLKRELLIRAAGGAATQVYTGLTPGPNEIGQDLKAFYLICEGLEIYEEAIDSYYEKTLAEAIALFQEPRMWAFITSLAVLLIERKSMSYRECRELYVRIVDGYWENTTFHSFANNAEQQA